METTPSTEITRLKPLKQWVAWTDGSGGTWTYVLIVTAVGTDGFEYGQTKLLGYESMSYLPILEQSWRELETALETVMRNGSVWA